VKQYELPAAVIINKVDNEHSAFNETVQVIKDHLSNDATVITLPVKEGLNFTTVVDLIKMKAFTYGEAGSKKVTEEEIPADLKNEVETMREELIEKVAESSEELMNKFFEEGTLYIDFSREIRVNFEGGIGAELCCLYGFINTLSEINAIKDVRFLLNGEDPEVMISHIYTAEPLTKNEDIIQKF